MTSLDYIVIILYFVVILAIGLYYYSRSSKNLEEYFLSGRNLPWWLAGISMVATTFAADTPLAVTGIVAKSGIAGNWLWWSLAMSGFFTVFLYARLWRRAQVFTDAEFSEIRYSGKASSFLRGFRAVYLAVPLNIVIMGWVTLGMAKVIQAAVPEWDKWQIIILLYAITSIYLVASGLWGVVISDFIQFMIAIGGSIILAIYVLKDFGGFSGLKFAFVNAGYSENLLSINPFGLEGLGFTVFAWLFVQWWSSWYPGAEPGGGGYIAQRILSVKNGKEAALSVFLFNILHYAVRPWPWIITALGSMIYFQGMKDPELGYPMAMLKLLPSGFLGLMIVAFLAAFMSTLSTHINWGASYLASDVYKRFVKKDGTQKEYIFVSRIFSVILLVMAYGVAVSMESVKQGWEIILAVGAGTGPVYLLRWYWWRINAWSEISAMAASFTGAVVLPYLVKNYTEFNLAFMDSANFGEHLIWTTLFSAAVWLSVTYLTPRENSETLKSFCYKTKAGGPGWKNYSENTSTIANDLGYWFFAVLSTYGVLAGFSQMFFGDFLLSVFILLLSISILGFLFIKLFKEKKFEDEEN